MVLEFYSQNKKILFAIFATVLVAGIFYLIINQFLDKSDEIACTMEAKLCSDGSSVSRIGPNCEFAPCPINIKEKKSNWITFVDKIQNVTFEYPASFLTTYMRAFDWPPQVQIVDGSVGCTEAGSEIERAGRTEKRIINGHEYCVTKLSEGAAGSIYTQYVYAVEKDKKTAIFTFSVSATQCGNYNDLQKIECENERASFNIDSLIDEVIQTLKFSIVGIEGNIVAQLDECLGKSDKASKEKCSALFKLVTNFEECVVAAFPIVGQNPMKCETPDGRIFSP